MTGGRHDEALVENEIRRGKRRLDVAVLPLLGGFALRHLAVCSAGEVLLGPLEGFDFGAGWCTARRCDGGWRVPHVALEPRVGTVRSEAHERIDDKRQLLERELDALDGLGCGELVDGGDRRDRLAL